MPPPESHRLWLKSSLDTRKKLQVDNVDLDPHRGCRRQPRRQPRPKALLTWLSGSCRARLAAVGACGELRWADKTGRAAGRPPNTDEAEGEAGNLALLERSGSETPGVRASECSPPCKQGRNE